MEEFATGTLGLSRRKFYCMIPLDYYRRCRAHVQKIDQGWLYVREIATPIINSNRPPKTPGYKPRDLFPTMFDKKAVANKIKAQAPSREEFEKMARDHFKALEQINGRSR